MPDQPAAGAPGRPDPDRDAHTPKGAIVIKVEADLSPIAAGNFVALASCGFYDGTVFHRTPTLQDGTPFVIQGGDPTGHRAPAAPATRSRTSRSRRRTSAAPSRWPGRRAPNSVGSQFFIVLDDKDGAVLGVGQHLPDHRQRHVRDGDADAIFAASGGVELPANPVPITTATVANP